MRPTLRPPLSADAGDLVPAAAVALADVGLDALPAVLDGVVRALGLRSAVLRSEPSGALVAVAGDVVHAVQQRRDPAALGAVVQLPVQLRGERTATLTVVGARPSQLPALRGLCAVLALAQPAAAEPLPLALLDATDAEADAAADALHDGPVQELVFARFAADAAVRGGDAASARDAVQAALQSLRRSLWLLRPRGAGEGGLGAALELLAERLVEAGSPRIALDVDADAAAAVAPHAATTAYRLVQACARNASDPLRVAVTRSRDRVRVRVDGARPLPTDRWAARALAVGGSLHTEPDGVLLSLPAVPAPVPPPARPVPAPTRPPVETEAIP